MSKITIDRAVVEQATKAMLNFPGDISDEMFESIRALKAVLAQQAEPDHETRAEIAEQQVVQLAEERDHYRNLWQKAQQAEPAQEPYTSERHFALREAYCIGAADAFWKARPGTKDDGRTIAFDAGFARGFDKGTCLAEQRLAALAQRAEPAEPVDVGLLEYRGNSVAFIHQKMTAYRAGIDAAWDAFRAKGLHPDGKTPLANMIAKYTAAPQRPAEPAQEPVAWRFEARHIDTAWGPAVSLKRPGPEHKYMRNVIPLYAAPPHQKQVGWMQKSTGVIRCDWGFDTTGYVPVYAVQEQSE